MPAGDVEPEQHPADEHRDDHPARHAAERLRRSPARTARAAAAPARRARTRPRPARCRPAARTTARARARRCRRPARRAAAGASGGVRRAALPSPSSSAARLLGYRIIRVADWKDGSMAMRSWLFVPGDSEAKLDKAPSCGADVVIVDLEDAVAPPAKPHARMLAEGLARTHAHGKPDGLRPLGADQPARHPAVARGSRRGDARAARRDHGAQGRRPRAAPGARRRALGAGTAQRHGSAARRASCRWSARRPPRRSASPTYAAAPLPRLAGLTWGAEDLSAAIGASRKRDERGYWTDAFRYVRAQVLLTAHARGVLAIDTLHAEFRDLEGLKRIAAEFLRRGLFRDAGDPPGPGAGDQRRPSRRARRRSRRPGRSSTRSAPIPARARCSSTGG